MAIFELTHQEVEKGHYFFVIALKKGGLIIFREPMKEIEKVKKKKKLIFYQNSLRLISRRIFDLWVWGTVIECVYQK